MVVYYVRWEKGDEPIKQQKGRRKIEKSYYDFTVLCRDCKDAYSCFEYLFKTEFERNTGVDISDGFLSMKRVKIDSRGFTIQYLFMDDIKRPLSLSNLKYSLMDVQRFTC